MQPIGNFNTVPTHFTSPSVDAAARHFSARGYRVRVDHGAPIARVPFDPRIRLQAAS